MSLEFICSLKMVVQNAVAKKKLYSKFNSNTVVGIFLQCLSESLAINFRATNFAIFV